MKKEPRRCAWSNHDDLYKTYHDTEWGRPTFEDPKIFEFLVLESAQAGLSWITILRKRQSYRKAFADFDPKKVARFGEAKILDLMKNAGIVRNELKIRAAVNNAKVFLAVQKQHGTFAHYIWSFVDFQPIQNRRKTPAEVPATTDVSDRLAKDMKALGFKFLGSTTLYAHMQATGMVNDHMTWCHCFKQPRPILKHIQKK